jgi:hypothetical protein
MDKINDGGPAFPMVTRFDHSNAGNPHYYASQSAEGMSLRQYYAGLAMQGILSNPDNGKISVALLERNGFDGFDRFVANFAVREADALIRELEKK